MRSRPFETRSRPRSLAATPRGFAFYVGFPKRSIRPCGLPIYVARVPAAPFARCPTRSLPPSQLYLDHSHCPCLRQLPLAALPSTRAIETPSLPSSLAATYRGFAFYVAFPKSSIVSRSLPLRSTATSRPHRPCRSTHSLHSLDRDVFYAWHAVALAKVGRSTPVGSVDALVSTALRLTQPPLHRSQPRPPGN